MTVSLDRPCPLLQDVRGPATRREFLLGRASLSALWPGGERRREQPSTHQRTAGSRHHRPQVLVDALGFDSPLSLPAAVDIVVPALAAALDGDPATVASLSRQLGGVAGRLS